MGNFFKQVLASFLGSGAAFLIAGFILIFMFVAIITSSITAAMNGDEDQGETKMTDHAVLHMKLEDPIVERANDKDFQFDFNTLEPVTNLGLNHIIKDLDKASKDDRIRGIFLDLTTVSASPATMETIREALEDFKTGGKWIVAYAESYSLGTYYLASAADETYLYPEGSLDFRGLGTELMFFKNMLEDLDIEVEVVRGPNNKYKSAVEPFMYDGMSEPNREQMQVLLGDIWAEMCKEIGENRNLSPEKLNMIADSLEVRVAADAVSTGLIDGLKYRDEVIAMLEAKSGIQPSDANEDGEEGSDDGLDLVSIKYYHKAKLKDGLMSKLRGKDRVAVVYAVGEIRSGEGDDMTIGSDRIARALREAREDEKVKAVVLRVNSPGGSALASDVIWRETELIKAADKPFVVSMGDLAASGGYYISAGADKIFANENTITGSIGVFGLIPNAEGFFNNKLGITFDRVGTNAHSGMMAVTKPLDDAEMAMLNESVESIYDRFTQLVADGRGMTQEDVDAIGQGRVWTGSRAIEVRLVDEIGNLDDAIAEAAEMAGLEDYHEKELPEFVDPFEELMKELSGEVKMQQMMEATGIPARYIHQVEQVKYMITEGDKIQARMPYYMSFE